MAQAGIDPLRQSHATYDTSKPPRLNYKKIICNRFYFQEFHSSEEYYFHTEDQIQRISKFCPKIRSMTFMFERISCPTKGISILWFVYFFQLSLYRTYIVSSLSDPVFPNEEAETSDGCRRWSKRCLLSRGDQPHKNRRVEVFSALRWTF